MKVNTQQKAKRLTTANYHKKNSKKNEGMKMIKQKKILEFNGTSKPCQFKNFLSAFKKS